MIFLRGFCLVGFATLLLPACGGAFDSGSRGDELSRDGGDDGTGGASNGSGGGGGSEACCLAAAICNPGDREISGPEECPPGADCYENAICCSQVWCVREAAQCRALPVCDPGDRQLDGACPPAYSCYSRSLCGVEITCLHQAKDGGPAPIDPAPDGGASCNPEAEYGRSYVGNSPAVCTVIDFGCPPNTNHFGNDCGCGCEQDPSCPEWANCMPGNGTIDPLCTEEGKGKCPYTQLAY